MTDRDRFAEHVDPNPTEQSVSPSVEETVQQPTAEQPLPVKDSASTKAGKMFNRMHNKLGRLHLFAAFCENPVNVSFQTQEKDEHVLLFLRKSQWVNFPWITMTIGFIALPIIIYIFRQTFVEFIPGIKYILVLLPLYYLLVTLYAFVNFITWYYNAALITDKRVVDIDFHQLVYKDVSETKLALVQDVNYNQTGVLPNILGYGFVLIQTAGTLDNFEFHNLPQPSRVEEIVEALIGGKRFYEP